MSDASPTRGRQGLVPHDIRIALEENGSERCRVVASVECERQRCTMEVEQCARCPRFVRIDVHEAGYVMLCHAHDDDETGPRPSEKAERSDS